MRIIAKGAIGQPPEWRPITSELEVDVLVREVLLRAQHGDLSQERMEQFIPLFETAERVRELKPWQRDFLAAFIQLVKADGPEAIAAAERAFELAMMGIE